MTSTKGCVVTDCRRPAQAKGYCPLHYNRWKRHGDPLVARRITPRGTSLADRLVRLSDRSGGPDACWPWTGSISHRSSATHLPYGTMTYEGRQRGAHVWSYVSANGEPPPETPFVLHSCDNSVCVNPAHLYAGTHRRNMADKVDRDRQARPSGEGNPLHRLTEAQVYEIRGLQGVAPSTAVGPAFGVSASTIQYIWNRKRWAHLPEITHTNPKGDHE